MAKDSSEIKTISKEPSKEEERKTNFTLAVLSGLLLVALGGIGYLYFNLKSSEPTLPKAFFEKKSIRKITGVQQEEEAAEPAEEPPTLSPERMEILAQIENHLIVIENQTVSPRTLMIKLYDQVTWENRDSEKYRITGTGWGGVAIEQGERFAQAFETPGTYEYSCTLHPGLSGTIIVE